MSGVEIDPSDPVQLIGALQKGIRTLLQQDGKTLEKAPDDVRATMRLADDYRTMPDRRQIGWDEHLAALVESEKRRQSSADSLRAEYEAARSKLYDQIEQERQEWKELLEQYKNPARLRVMVKEPPDYGSQKEQIRELRSAVGHLSMALKALRDAQQLVSEKHLQAVGITSKILMTPELQDTLNDALNKI
jgi:hypothetical protein